jgi:hypothetical protein
MMHLQHRGVRKDFLFPGRGINHRRELFAHADPTAKLRDELIILIVRDDPNQDDEFVTMQ